MNRRALVVLTIAAALAVFAESAAAVTVTVPRIIRNDGIQLRAVGTVISPAAASNCVALVRAQLQVPAAGEGYRAVRALGRHRVQVCENDLGGGRSSGSFTVWFSGMRYLRSQPARLCWSATQTVNGLPSTHISCKRFQLRGGS